MVQGDPWLMLQPIGYAHLHRQVLDRVHLLLAEGKLKPGDTLPSERHLAELLAVSRGTLREALRILEHRGVIETKPGGRRRIRQLRSEEEAIAPEEIVHSLRRAAILDLLEARLVLEERIVELACERATEADLLHIQQAYEASLADSFMGGMGGMGDLEFHTAIAEATHNLVLVSMVRLQMELIREVRGVLLRSALRRKAMETEHDEIRSAVLARDVDAAKRAVALHMSNVRHEFTTITLR